MIGKKYPSEMKTRIDQKTGHTVVQLTGGESNNYHLYFTENSFCKGTKELIFYSDRGTPPAESAASGNTPATAKSGAAAGGNTPSTAKSGAAPAGNTPAPSENTAAVGRNVPAGQYNLFSLCLDTGEITQLTDFTGPISHCIKPPDGKMLFCFHKNHIVRIDMPSLEQRIVYTCPPEWRLTSMSLNHSGTRLGFILNEHVAVPTGANYTGFTENMYAIKRSKIMSVSIDGSPTAELFHDTHQLGHFQFAPEDDTVAMFCHEGPWNLVHQRIWLLDLVARTVAPCFRQEADDSVGHEFWTRDNLVFFDNRRAGHDGTITSDKTQVYQPPEDAGQTPYIGFADTSGTVIRTVEMPFYCNHYHADNTNEVLVGDDVEDLVLIHIASGTARLKTLCFHGTSWYGQSSHCHPTFDWEGRFVLWTSDFGGKHNIYMADTRQVTW